jgi:hypothetical protein
MTDQRPLRPIGSVPAFPNDQGLRIADRVGMSKREHFAVLLLAGMNANPEKATATHLMIEDAMLQADLLIEVLGKADRTRTLSPEPPKT